MEGGRGGEGESVGEGEEECKREFVDCKNTINQILLIRV